MLPGGGSVLEPPGVLEMVEQDSDRETPRYPAIFVNAGCRVGLLPYGILRYMPDIQEVNPWP